MAKDKAHIIYRVKDKIVPGATTVTGVLNKPALPPWANKIGLQGIQLNKYVDDKADIGTLAHAMCINELIGSPTDTSDYSANQIDKAENSFLSFQEWCKGKVIEVKLTETPMVSESLMYGGTLDIYAIVDGVPELIDLKTGSGIYIEHFIQTSAYRNLLLEAGKPVERVRIINIPRSEDENFKEEVMVNTAPYFEIFCHCLDIYYLMKNLKVKGR